MTDKSPSGPVAQATDDAGGPPASSVLCTNRDGPEIYNPDAVSNRKDEVDTSPIPGESSLSGKYAQAQAQQTQSADSIDARISGWALHLQTSIT